MIAHYREVMMFFSIAIKLRHGRIIPVPVSSPKLMLFSCITWWIFHLIIQCLFHKNAALLTTKVTSVRRQNINRQFSFVYLIDIYPVGVYNKPDFGNYYKSEV